MRRALVAAATAGALALPGVAHARAPLTVSTSIAPSPAFFGQPVTARAEIVVDRSAVDPDAVRFAPNFTPYAIVGRTQRSRSDSGPVTTLGYVFTLLCLNDDCLPGEKLRAVRLPVAHVVAGSEDVVARWPRVLVSTRVTAAAAKAARPPWRVQLALPAVSYSIRPGRASTVLVAAALLLGLAGIGLVGWEAARRRRLRLERERALSRLQEALTLLRESADRSADDRRKALALLARELNGERDLARDATRLAWGRKEPSAEGIGSLVRRVEQTMEQR